MLKNKVAKHVKDKNNAYMMKNHGALIFGHNMTRPVPFDFNKQVRELCDEFGALLIFDEVVTGFRIGMGGAQGYFDVKPDLTIFGKCVTGGYPMAGGVGGRREVINTFAAGQGNVLILEERFLQIRFRVWRDITLLKKWNAPMHPPKPGMRETA